MREECQGTENTRDPKESRVNSRDFFFWLIFLGTMRIEKFKMVLVEKWKCIMKLKKIFFYDVYDF